MMGSAEAVATAQHFVKERLKEIEARGLPTYLLTTTITYLRRTRYSLTCPALPCLTHLLPCLLKAHNAQRAAGGGGALPQGASHSVAPHGTMGAPQVTPHPRLAHPCSPMHPPTAPAPPAPPASPTCAPHLAAPLLARLLCAVPAAGLRGAGLRAAGLPAAGLLAAAAVALPAAQHAQHAAGHAAHAHGAAVQHEHDVRRPARTVSAVAVRPACEARCMWAVL